MKFTRHPRIEAEESLVGYFLRIMESNGISSFRHMVREVSGQPEMKTPKGSGIHDWIVVHLENFSRLTLNKGDVLADAAWSYKSAGQMRKRNTVARHHLNFTTPRFCPHCLSEKQVWRREWDLALSTACHRHQTQLCDSCPKCNRPLRWNRLKLLSCHECESDFAASPTIGAGSGELILAQVIGSCLSDCALSSQTGSAHSLLARMPLWAVLELVSDLIQSGHRHHLAMSGSSWLDNAKLDQTRSRVESVFSLFDDWPRGLARYLSQDGQGRSLFDNRSCATFANVGLSLLVRKPLFRKEAEFFKRALEDYQSKWSPVQPFFDGTKIYGRHKLFTKSQLDEAELEEYLGLPETFIRIAKDAGVLPADGGFVTGHDIPYSKSDCNHAKAFLQGLIPSELAMTILGISRRHLERLSQAGLLRLFAPQETWNHIFKGTKPSIRYIHVTEIQNLYKVYADAAAQMHSENLRFIPFNATLTGRFTRGGLTIDRLVALVAQGVVRVARGEDKLGLQSFSFCRDDLVAATSSEVEAKIHLSLAEVARKLGIYATAVTQVIRLGLLPSESIGSKTRRVTSDAFECFNRDYVFVRELAQRLGCQAKTLGEKLMDEGITPASGPRIDGGLVYVFKRADLEGRDLAAIASKSRYATKTGRRKGGSANAVCHADTLTLAEVASELGCSEQMVTQRLLPNGLVKALARRPNAAQLAFEPAEIKAFKAKLGNDSGFLPEAVVLRLLNESRSALAKRWIRSKRLTPHQDGLEVYYLESEVQGLLALKRTWCTSQEAATHLGIDPREVSNLVRLGKLVPVSGPQLDGSLVLSFDREQVLALVKQAV